MAKLRLTDQKGSLEMLLIGLVLIVLLFLVVLVLFEIIPDPDPNIPDKPRDAGELVSIKVEKGSFSDRVTSTVDTTKGTFCVYGYVPEIKGAPVTIHIRKNQLCINKACYTVFRFSIPNIIDKPRNPEP